MNPNRRTILKGALALALASGSTAHAQTPRLIRRTIPATGEAIPVIGLGTARRYEEVRSAADLVPLQATVQRFETLGGTVIDTSASYGTAETAVGTIVEALKIRASIFLSTKVDVVGREAGVSQIEQSFKALRTPKIDLLSVHNLRDTQVQLRTLRDLKATGRIRYIGITTSFDRQYSPFEDTMRRERLDFIQVDYALDNRGAGERILPLAADRGMAVMINLPFGRGRLFSAVQGRALPPWAAEFDCRSWAQFFLKYIVSHPAVTVAVPGMAKPEYAEDNLQAAQGRLPDAALRRRMEVLIDEL
jgi:aryl-alcohol dehydrogenase-like predicted oxidoreductase